MDATFFSFAFFLVRFKELRPPPPISNGGGGRQQTTNPLKYPDVRFWPSVLSFFVCLISPKDIFRIFLDSA